MGRRRSRWAGILERADDELVAALESLASLFRGDGRAEGRRQPGQALAELHKSAWALGLRVALAGEDVVLLDPELRDEAARIGGLWRQFHPARPRAAARPAPPPPPAPPAKGPETSELIRKVDDLKVRLAHLQDRMGVTPLERRARR